MRPIVAFVLCLAASAVLALAMVVGGATPAHAFETITLEERDHIIAESPGCKLECRALGPRRSCTVRDFDCRAVCMDIPECSQPGRTPVKACAIIRSERR